MMAVRDFPPVLLYPEDVDESNKVYQKKYYRISHVHFVDPVLVYQTRMGANFLCLEETLLGDVYHSWKGCLHYCSTTQVVCQTLTITDKSNFSSVCKGGEIIFLFLCDSELS